MDTGERTFIRSFRRIRQANDFRGLCFGGNKYPTDIDGFYDEAGNKFVFIETKFDDAEMDRGQELAYEHLCDACERGGTRSIVLVASHHAEGNIDTATLPVTKYRLRGAWYPVKKPVTVREAMEWFLERKERKI